MKDGPPSGPSSFDLQNMSSGPSNHGSAINILGSVAGGESSGEMINQTNLIESSNALNEIISGGGGSLNMKISSESLGSGLQKIGGALNQSITDVMSQNNELGILARESMLPVNKLGFGDFDLSSITKEAPTGISGVTNKSSRQIGG